MYVYILNPDTTLIMGNKYISPDMEILDIMSEGVLCASNETLEENEGIW